MMARLHQPCVLVPATLLLLLLIMVFSLSSGHGEGQKISVVTNCRCSSMTMESRTLKNNKEKLLLNNFESSACSCSSESNLQNEFPWSVMSLIRQNKPTTALSSLTSLMRESYSYITPLPYSIRRSLTMLSVMESAASLQSPGHHFFARTPNMATNVKPNHSSHRSSAPAPAPVPTSHSNTKTPNSTARAPKIAPSSGRPAMAPGPASPRRRRSGHHHATARSPPAPAPAPVKVPKPKPMPSSPTDHLHPGSSANPPSDCSNLVCTAPLTKAPFLAPCGCVRPMQVEIELSVPLYALFPLISVLAAEIAEGTVLKPSQVEIVGANAAGQNEDFSVVDTNLLPLNQEFDNDTALIIFQKLWNHELVLNKTLFGNYSIIYVNYPGLPPSPPSEAVGGQVPGLSGIEQPIGVDVSKATHKKTDMHLVAVISLSSVVALVICLGALWLVFAKCSRHSVSKFDTNPGPALVKNKKSGLRSSLSSDLCSSISMSFASSITTYANTARTFSLVELERATDNFRPENVIGEGGFGRVFSGVLDDRTKVAVKVLTRDDQQGSKEFIAEVEMLSRLHHRNLVKLIGICTEDHSRCLVYELVPNGSVESHLHGIDRNHSPLTWETRMKIALGSARGLAYLHEDSNPRVIHRDFKAANILLEDDFNPKVSDFGLAKVAPDEGSGHLSTRVMGTFGYVAPEYAMTGHLLVKSDVYSYGVVLLELLSGRKPVDMSQPPGQENLVTWARPLLTSSEGLKVLVDPDLKDNFPFESLARVAAIASMCVQPEVSHRPFMGEVVQALKLVYNDCDVKNGAASSTCSQGGDSASYNDARDVDHWNSNSVLYGPDDTSFISVDYDSGASHRADKRQFSASAFLHESARFIQYRTRESFSGPLRPGHSRFSPYRQTSLRGSISEHLPLARNLVTGQGRDGSRHNPAMEGNSLDFSRL